MTSTLGPFHTGFSTVIFDCDSTLSTIEGIDELGRLVGKEAEVAKLTNLSMEGKVSLEEVFAKRLELIKPTIAQLERVGQQYIDTVVDDAKILMECLSYLDKEVFIVSGGYRLAVLPLATWLGIPEDHVFAIDLDFDEQGHYEGFDPAQPLTHSDGKKEVISALDIPPDEILLLGDGATDLEAEEVVGMFVGYGGVVERSLVKKKAKYFLNSPSILPVIFLAASPIEQNLLQTSQFEEVVGRSFTLAQQYLRIPK